MMNVNALSNIPIHLLKIEITHNATRTVIVETLLSSLRVPFASVYDDPPCCALNVLPFWQLLGQPN